MGEMLHVIPPSERTPAGLRRVLAAHPEVRFVSLAGVDLGGNDTDEKIPAGHFLAHLEEYLAGGVQTDGSSVVLPGIATLNDGKVDLVADPGVRWYVDHNHEHVDPSTGLHVGTLRIPSFLKHRDRFIDSRAILRSREKSCLPLQAPRMCRSRSSFARAGTQRAKTRRSLPAFARKTGPLFSPFTAERGNRCMQATRIGPVWRGSSGRSRFRSSPMEISWPHRIFLQFDSSPDVTRSWSAGQPWATPGFFQAATGGMSNLLR